MDERATAGVRLRHLVVLGLPLLAGVCVAGIAEDAWGRPGGGQSYRGGRSSGGGYSGGSGGGGDAWLIYMLFQLIFRYPMVGIPLAAIVLCLGLRGLPASQEDAARLAGRSPWPIALRHLAPHLLVAWAGVYLLALTEYGAATLLAPPGKSLLAVFVVNEAHYGQGPELAALSLLLLCTALLPLGLLLAAAGAWRRWERAS